MKVICKCFGTYQEVEARSSPFFEAQNVIETIPNHTPFEVENCLYNEVFFKIKGRDLYVPMWLRTSEGLIDYVCNRGELKSFSRKKIEYPFSVARKQIVPEKQIVQKLEKMCIDDLKPQRMAECEPEQEPQRMAEPEPEQEPQRMAEPKRETKQKPQRMAEPEPEREPQRMAEPEPEREPQRMIEPKRETKQKPQRMAECEPEREPISKSRGGRTKKERIPATVRNIVWVTHFQSSKKGQCWLCKVEDISSANFECGHVVSEKNGGRPTVDNLRPICSFCNKSVGTMNMEDFKRKYNIP